MKKFIYSIFILILLTCVPCYGATVVPHTVYGVNSEVTSTTLNGNVTATNNQVNGGLDNTNADTADGFRFIEVVGSEPAAGTEGRVIYLTTDDTLEFDNGSAWLSVVTPSTAATAGDTVYYNGTNWINLSKGTANQMLTMNSGATAPEWQAGVPSGVIVMWSGAISAIPTGWVICDGNNSTPNLTDRFVIHADDDSGGTRDVDDTGGSWTISEANLPAHTHTIRLENAAGGASTDAAASGNDATVSEMDTGSVGSGTDYLPKYYALAYIMKS